MPAGTICPLPQSYCSGTSGLYLQSLLLTRAGKTNEGRAKVLPIAVTVGLLPGWEAQGLSRTEFLNLRVKTPSVSCEISLSSLNKFV